MGNVSSVWNGIGWIFGALFFVVGLINIMWGNDPEYGAFILLLSFVFVPHVGAFIKARTGYRIHPSLKSLVGIFIIWSALGVGELPAKIDMMLKDLSYLETLTFEEII